MTKHPDRIGDPAAVTSAGVVSSTEAVSPVVAADWVRRRHLEQQLHDGPALRLAAVALRLGVCNHQAPADATELRACIAEVQDELHSVLQELREVSSQIYPPMLAAAGLGAALEAMAERLGLPVTVQAPDERYSAAVEAAAYFRITEQLLSRAGSASTASIAVRRRGPNLELTIATTGRPERGSAASEDEVSTVTVPCE